MRIQFGILGRVGLPQEDYCSLLPRISPMLNYANSPRMYGKGI